jgi:hypothetical protein
MATTYYFDETIRDQGGKGEMEVKFGRSSFYSGCAVPQARGKTAFF